MKKLLFLNALRWYLRVPLKGAIFALTVLAVCFPYPHLLVRHLEHWRDPNRLIEPEAPALAPLLEELRPRLTPEPSGRRALKIVEKFVYQKIKYAWDWETWGTADYLPTVTEAIEMGREDCDGRAVVAASLLKNLGFEVELVTDFAHVWVKTDRGEIMSPGKRKAVVATTEGLQVQEGAWAQVPRALAYGIAPFPLVRELIVVVVLWWLLLRTGGGFGCGLVALVLLVDGLLFARIGGADHNHPIVWMQLVGLAHILATLVALLVWAPYHARKF